MQGTISFKVLSPLKKVIVSGEPRSYVRHIATDVYKKVYQKNGVSIFPISIKGVKAPDGFSGAGRTVEETGRPRDDVGRSETDPVSTEVGYPVEEPIRHPSSSSSIQQVLVRVAEPEFAQCEPCGPDDEDTLARVRRSPVKPTQAMIDEHEVAHLPVRSWCLFCIRGRGVSVGHSHHIPHDGEQVRTLSVDYGFLGGAQFIAVKDRSTKCLWSMMVPRKGWSHACMEVKPCSPP